MRLLPIMPGRLAIAPCSHDDVLFTYPHAMSPYVAFFSGRMVPVLGDAIGMRCTMMCRDCGADLGVSETWFRI